MNEHASFVDIHCHLLPGLDDGPSTLSESLAMAEMAVADGVTTIVATPHQLGNYLHNTGDAILAAVARFQHFLDERRVPLRVLPGADVRIEPDFMRKIRTGEALTLGNHHRHILLELPHDVYVPLEGLLAELNAHGLVGILSHPERNRGILRQPHVLRPLVERGCLLQVTAGSLTGDFGHSVQCFCKSLIQQGLVHFVCTDAHGIKARSPKLGPAFEIVTQLAGYEIAMDLCSRHATAVAAGNKVQAGCRHASKSTWMRWFRHTHIPETTGKMSIQ